MKKFLITIIILLLVIIFILLYCNCKKNQAPPASTTGFCQSNACNGATGEVPEGMLSFSLAKSMSEDYARDSGKRYVWEGNVATDSLDARSIWFDLKKMKTFIAYVEESLCKKGCNDTTSIGIRFYYAKYPGVEDIDHNTDLAGVPTIYARRHTLFLVPTVWDPVKKINVDFDPSSLGSNCTFRPMDTLKSKVWIALPNTASGEQGKNHGSLMPPPAGGGSLPTN